MNKKINRLNKIMEILRNNNGASLKQIAQILDISEMTVRRDLQALSKNNLITLIKGVAIFNQNGNISLLNNEYDLNNEHIINVAEKQRIGQAAASLLEPEDVIIIDSGTTTELLAKYIPFNMNLTVVCYAMNTLIEVKKKSNCKIIFAGGYYHENTQMFHSPESIALISRTCANKAFIAAAGVNRNFYVTSIEQYEIETKIAALKSSLEKILLVDSKKFDKICPVMFGELSTFDKIITDTNLSDDWVRAIRDKNIELMLV